MSFIFLQTERGKYVHFLIHFSVDRRLSWVQFIETRTEINTNMQISLEYVNLKFLGVNTQK